MNLDPVPNNAAPRAAFLYALPLLAVLALSACQPSVAPAATEPTAATDPAPPSRGAPRSIGVVQGRGPRSEYAGDMVSVQGVVTGNFVNGLSGFFMQDATGAEDGDRDTSDAIFVEFARGRTPKVRRGDRVSVLGRVVELGEGEHSLTALSKVEVEVLGRAAVRASEVSAAPNSAADWEALEGMWLRINSPLTVTGNHNLLRYGELLVAFDGDLRHPTDAHAPGPKARALAEDNRRRRLLLDDNRAGEYPHKLWFLAEPLSQATPLRAGSVIGAAEGVLDYRYGSWRLQLTEQLSSIEQAPRPAPPDLPAGLRLGSFNLLNLFNGNGRGGGFPTERGAPTRVDYLRQRAKLVASLATLRPDIAALAEVENDGFGEYSAIAGLLGELNKTLGEEGDYVAIEGGIAGSDPIRVGILYRRGKVEPIGAAASPSDGVFAEGRPPLAQTFRVAGGARTLTVVANHFKSKGGCADDAADGDRDAGDGQGCWNALRVEMARQLDAWLKTDPTQSGSPHRVLLGDFNAYSREDPIRLLRSAGWRDALGKRSEGATQYSYRFDGQAGSLDHALLSPSLTAALLGAAHWTVNSDESEAFDYHSAQRPPGLYEPTAIASSDHNPLLVVLDPLKATQ